jgi:hypothetical protein
LTGAGVFGTSLELGLDVGPADGAGQRGELGKQEAVIVGMLTEWIVSCFQVKQFP